MNEDVEDASNETRLQDFLCEVSINYDQLALLLSSFFASCGKLYLILDRTQWQFGKRKVNILMAMISYGQMQLPVYWELLDNNGGGSSTSQRIDIVNKCIALLGVNRIAAVIADAEFIGAHACQTAGSAQKATGYHLSGLCLLFRGRAILR